MTKKAKVRIWLILAIVLVGFGDRFGADFGRFGPRFGYCTNKAVSSH